MDLLDSAPPLADGLLLAYVTVAVGYGTARAGLALTALVRLLCRPCALLLEDTSGTGAAPPVTLLAPVHARGGLDVEAVYALLGVAYPSKEVLLVDDGPTDDALARLVDAFDLVPAERPLMAPDVPHRSVSAAYRSRRCPELWLIRKAGGGGAADAVNAGLAYARTPLVCVLDGGGRLAPDAIHRAVQPFLEDTRTAAVGGATGVADECHMHHGRVGEVRMPRAWSARFQVLECLRAAVATRLAWDHLGALRVVPGSFGVFRRDAVVAIEGSAGRPVEAGAELVLRLRRASHESGQPWRVAYAPDAVSWRPAPEPGGAPGRRRDGWHRGLAWTLWEHRRTLLHVRNGRAGTLAVPAYVLVEVVGPLVEAVGLVGLVAALALGALDVPLAAALLSLAFALGLAESVTAVALEQLASQRYTRLRDLGLLFAVAIVENVGYRQVKALWRLRGLACALPPRAAGGERPWAVSPAS